MWLPGTNVARGRFVEADDAASRGVRCLPPNPLIFSQSLTVFAVSHWRPKKWTWTGYDTGVTPATYGVVFWKCD